MIATVAETDLWDQYIHSGAPEIREQLVLQSVPLVYYMLGRMGITREAGPDYEDFVHQGLLGLIDAVDRYDPAHGTRFSTYATIRIRGKIIDYMRACDWMSRSSRRRVRQIQNGVSRFWLEQHREPTDEELAAYLNLDIEDVQQGLTDSNRVFVSLDTASEKDQEEEVSLYETQVDEKQADPSDIFTENEQKLKLVQALQQLPEREQQVLSLYYFEELTFKEIGKVLAVSESRVCQLHARAILAIKALLNDD